MTKIRAPQAWDVTTSIPAVKVAVLDCGVYGYNSTFVGPDGIGHIDVRDKVDLHANFSGAPDSDDWCDHGTHVAGIAAAATNNAIGVAGAGFNARLYNGKVLDDSGSGTFERVVDGIYWAANNDAHVLNLSLGAPPLRRARR